MVILFNKSEKSTDRQTADFSNISLLGGDNKFVIYCDI